MASTRQVRSWWMFYRCSPGVRRESGFFGRHPVFEQRITHDAVSALEQAHYESGYVPTPGGYIGSKRQCPAGIGGRKCEPSGYNCSTHNYVIAYDVEYQYNKHIKSPVTYEDFDEEWFPWVCKYTLEQVRAIEKIKNTDGEYVWKWLGWPIGDFMHWQINVPPTRTAVDWSSLPLSSEDMGFCKRGDTSQTVLFWQYMLQSVGYEFTPPTEFFGSTMVNALKDLGFDGQQVGPSEAAALYAAVSTGPYLMYGDTVRLVDGEA